MRLLLSVFSSFCALCSFAQPTVGLTQYDTENLDGYVLFSPMTSTGTYLIDKCGEKVHEWTTSSYRPGLSSYLLEDGSLMRSGILDNPNFDEGGSGGIIEKFDWNGNLVWSYTLSDDDMCQHHDFTVLPNGNILVIVWDRYTSAEAIANGKNTSYANSHLWSEKIVELQPVGANSATIVWEWKLWDHLVQDFDNTKPNFGVVADEPGLVDLNYFPGQPTSVDWIHLNSIDYNAELDQLLVSSHTLNEIWVIDHSTSTVEASGHTGGNSNKGGDLLYRWGNPQTYDRGNPTTKVFYGQHHASWIPQGYPNAGKIIVFNNGLNRPGTYSSIDMIETPIDASQDYPIDASSAFLPTSLFWTYTAPTPSDFYSSNISGVYPLSNGSFLIASGANGTFFEINSAEETVWEYINPVTQSGILTQGDAASNNVVFRCNFYPTTFAGFDGHILTPLGEIENNPTEPSICDAFLGTSTTNGLVEMSIYPNPFSDYLYIDHGTDAEYLVKLTDAQGHILLIEENSTIIDLSGLSSGFYNLSVIQKDGTLRQFKLVK
ncbi:MAG: aryl-sulfate sulfotransferase [Fluviicola sp.]|nr:aryl-sulfate sulfotransferase [Fluviicola sp.]